MTMLPRQPDSNSVEPPRRLRLAAEPRHHESWQEALTSHFTMVPNGLLRGDLSLSHAELRVLLVLLSWAESPGSAGRGASSVTIKRPGGIRITSLAEWADQSRTQTKRSLKVLEQRGFITTEQRAGEPSTYTVHHDAIARHIKMPPVTVKDRAPAPKRGVVAEVDDLVDRITAPVAGDLDDLVIKAHNLPTTGRRRKGTTPNQWAGSCLTCETEVPAGSGIMWRGGPRHHRCMPPRPLTPPRTTTPVRNKDA